LNLGRRPRGAKSRCTVAAKKVKAVAAFVQLVATILNSPQSEPSA
jgi:hypothetical protein